MIIARALLLLMFFIESRLNDIDKETANLIQRAYVLIKPASSLCITLFRYYYIIPRDKVNRDFLRGNYVGR